MAGLDRPPHEYPTHRRHRDLAWWHIPTWTPRWHLKLLAGLVGGLAGGLVFGLAGGLVYGLGGGLGGGLGHGLAFGLMVGLVVGLVAGLVVGLVAGLVVGLVFGLVVGLVFGLVVGLVFGLVFGLGVGAAPSLWLLEVLFFLQGRRVRFLSLLEDALKRQVLRQAGAVYQFRHADLQDRLADRSGTTASVPPARRRHGHRRRSRCLSRRRRRCRVGVRPWRRSVYGLAAPDALRFWAVT